MDTQVLVDELVTAYADILKLTVVIGELGHHNLKALQESRKRELQLRNALLRLQRSDGGWCWCWLAGMTGEQGHTEACNHAYSTLFGVERGRDAKES